MRGHPADCPTPRYLVDAARGGCQHRIAVRTESPTDIVDLDQALATSRGDTIQAVGSAHIYLAVESRDSLYLTREAIFRQDIRIDRRQFDGEDAMCRSAPKQSVMVVGHVRHLIGTEAVSLGNGIKLATIGVGNSQPLVLPDLHLDAAI